MHQEVSDGEEQEAVQRGVQARGGAGGEEAWQFGGEGCPQELELSDSVLRRWIRQFGSGRWEAAPGKSLKAASTQELERVKRELNQVRMERDILRKGLACLAKDPA
jgi:hypothetical protein